MQTKHSPSIPSDGHSERRNEGVSDVRNSNGRAVALLTAFFVLAGSNIIPVELHFVISLVIAGALASRYGLPDLSSIWPLIAILAIALLMIIPMGYDDFLGPIRTFFYLSRPILFISIGILLNRLNNSEKNLLISMALAGFIMAIIYFFKYISSDVSILSERSNLRGSVGTGYFLNMVSIYLLFFRRKIMPWTSFAGFTMGSFCFAMILLSDSRTNLICLLLFSFIGFASVRSLVNTAAPFVVAALLLAIISTPLLPSMLSEGGYAAVRERLPTSIREFTVHEGRTYRQIVLEWRGFETYLVFANAKKVGPLAEFFGIGAGQGVPLPVKINLGNDESPLAIGVFHNGFAMTFARSGWVGVILFLIQISIFASISSRLARRGNMLGKLGLSMTAAAIVTNTVIAGIYNPGDVSVAICVVLGFVIASHNRFRSRATRQNSPN